jgi:hypothetical protein
MVMKLEINPMSGNQVVNLVDDNGNCVYTLLGSTVYQMMLAHKADSERVFTADQVKAEITKMLSGPLARRPGDVAALIYAIKRHRVMTGSGLLEAKLYCEALQRNLALV